MKLKALLVACLIWPMMTFAAESTKFRAAHTSVRDTSMLIFIVGDSFFFQDSQTQQRWYTSLQSCARSVKLAGEVIAVANVNGTFKSYGPKSWQDFLRTIDMPWVNARVNKEITCNF
ncbi:MAG: hypothetical protein IT507_03490 [Burkholderiaceae bacterium]|nr:hypothetical protein [Burkholderiaceae bacterium]